MPLTNDVLGDNTPVGEIPVVSIPEKPKREAPGFFRSIYEGFKEGNPEINTVTAAVKGVNTFNSWFDEVPDNWTPITYDAIKDHDPEDWEDILSALTPKNQELIKQRKTEERANKEWLDTGSTIGKLGGYGLGFGFSFANKIKIASEFTSLSKSNAFVRSAANAVPGLVGQSIVVNASRQASHDTLGLDDFFIDTLIDTTFGAAIFAGVGLKRSLNLNGRLGSLKNLYKDVEYVAEVGEKGEWKGWKAQPMNSSVGAAEVEQAQKFVNEGLDKFGESPWFRKVFGLSPVVKMATSQFLAVREWGGLMFRPSGLLKLKASFTEGEQSAEQIFKGLMANAYQSGKKINETWQDYIGIDPLLPAKDMLGHLKNKLSSEEWLTRSQFSEQVATAFRNGDVNPAFPKAEEAAKWIRKNQYDKLYQEAVKLDMLPPDLDPITAISYLNRVHDKIKMNLYENDWKDAVAGDLIKQSQEIRAYMAPINALRDERKHLREINKSLKANNEGIRSSDKTPLGRAYKKSRDELKRINRDILEEQAKLDAKVLSKEIDPILVSTRMHYTEKELKELESIRAPFLERETGITKSIDSGKKELKKLREDLKYYRRSKPKEAKKPENKIIEEINSKIKNVKEDIKLNRGKMKIHKEDMQSELFQLHYNEKINKRFYKITPKTGKIKLVEPQTTPPLRKALTPDEAKAVAQKSYLKILGDNEEQMLAQAFEEGTASGGTNPLMARTLMVRDTTIQPWLINDMETLTHLYSGFMARKIASQKVFNSMGANSKDGVEGIIEKLNKEYLEKRAVLNQIPAGKERDKAITRLKKGKDKDIELLKRSWKAFWGNYNAERYSPTQAGFLSGLRSWTAATALGALPLMQLTDIAMMQREFGIAPILKESLFPMISNLFERGSFKFAAHDHAHAGLGMNTALAAYSDGLFGHGTQYHPRGWMSRYFGMAAEKLGNITGSNQMEDMFQHMVGVMSQSKTIRALEKWKAGEALSKAEHERLFLLGLNKGEFGERILKQYYEFGEAVNYKSGAKAHIANFENWADQEAAQVFLNTIKQEVDSIILKTNLADTPFCFRDPLIQSITMFTGYAFASTNQRLANLIQRPTANKVMGELSAMTIGAYVNPLRELLEGKEPDVSIKALIASAITNGAPGGIFIDGFNRMNAIFDIPYLRSLKSDRHRGKGASKLLLGAPGNLIDNVVNIAQTAINLGGGGAASEGEAKRFFKAIPWAWAWETRYGVNALIESWNLGKQSRPAEGRLFSE